MKQLPLSEENKQFLNELGLDLKHLHGVCIQTYEFSEVLFHEGTPIHHLMIILKGTAKLQYQSREGKNLILSHQTKGIMGDIELMTGVTAFTTTVTAGTYLEVLALPFDLNKEYLYGNKSFLQYIGRELGFKLLRSSNYYIASSLYSAKARLSYYILKDSYNGLFRAHMKDVAATTGMSYRHMYRILDELCKEKILKKVEHGYLILDEERLRIQTITEVTDER